MNDKSAGLFIGFASSQAVIERLGGICSARHRAKTSLALRLTILFDGLGPDPTSANKVEVRREIVVVGGQIIVLDDRIDQRLGRKEAHGSKVGIEGSSRNIDGCNAAADPLRCFKNADLGRFLTFFYLRKAYRRVEPADSTADDAVVDEDLLALRILPRMGSFFHLILL